MRNTTGLVGGATAALLIFIIALAFHLLFAVGNFLIVEQAFLAQNWEQVPVRTLPFAGPFLSAFGLGDATVSQVFAAGLVGVINVIFWILAGLAFGLVSSALNLREANRKLSEREFIDEDEAALRRRTRQVQDRIAHCAIWLVILIPIAYFIVAWDISQFRMRWELNILNQADASLMVGETANSQERLGAYLNGLLGVSAAGYIACMLGACVASHYALDQLKDKCGALSEGLGRTWEDAVAGDMTPVMVVGPAPFNSAEEYDEDPVSLPDLDPIPEATYAEEIPDAPEPGATVNGAESEDPDAERKGEAA